MLTALIIAVLLYVVCVTSYVLWTHMKRNKRSGRDNQPPSMPPPENTIIGKSLFTMPVSDSPKPSTAKSEPLDAKPEGNQKEAGNSNNFVSSKSQGSVPEQNVEPEDPDDNPLLPIDVPLEYKKEDSQEEEENEEESEEVEGLRGASFASGLTFEDMGQAVTVVVHYPQATPQECLQAGRTLRKLENTELFEHLASSAPQRRDIVSELMDVHMKDYLEGIGEAKSRKSKVVPEGFDINDLVQQIKT